MNDFILKVPAGDMCLGCMFLEIITWKSGFQTTRCKLFQESLSGDVKAQTVMKCRQCPRAIHD